MQINDSRYAATIGFFDGVHCGHRYLLEQLRVVASARGLKTMAVTFREHPRQTLHNDYQPQLLTTLEERIVLLKASRVDEVKILDFTEEFAKMTSREFMTDILHKTLGVDCLLIGYDHHFGSDTENGFDHYLAVGQEVGIEVELAKPFYCGTDNISSSFIRRLLAEGDVECAELLLHRHYCLCGTVVEGHKVGRSMGFPTANLRPNDSRKVIPQDGAYAVDVIWKEKTYRGVLNIGRRPTLANGNDRSIEVFILDFNADIYGEILQVEFLKRLRGEKRFDSLEELKKQIVEDAAVAREVKRFIY